MRIQIDAPPFVFRDTTRKSFPEKLFDGERSFRHVVDTLSLFFDTGGD